MNVKRDRFLLRMRGWSIAAIAAMALASGVLPAHAQGGGGGPGPLDPATLNAALAGPGAVFDLGSKFLRDNADQANATLHGPDGNNPGGGGADLAVTGESAGQRYRMWGEAYGLSARTGAQNAFTGDRRETFGGILGLGTTLAPGVSLGISVDQGHTRVGIRNLPQSSRIDLTQIGASAIFESGPWTFTAAGIHGFGDIRMRRTDSGGEIIADYGASLWGTIAELSYYAQSGPWRFVPRVGLDWTRIEVDDFVESGGAIPVAITSQHTRRLRAFAGAEIGYSWLAQNAVFDLGVYARLIDILSQDVDSVLATPTNATALARTVPGLVDERLEFNGGASASVKVSDSTRFYLVYDARVREDFTAHAGTLGFEVRW